MGVGFQTYLNGLDYAIDLSKYLIVPKSQHPESGFLKNNCTLHVMRSLVLMLPTIDFDDQFDRETNKIENVILKRMLPSKLQSKLIATQSIPQFTLGIGHIPTQRTLEFVRLNVCAGLSLHNQSVLQPISFHAKNSPTSHAHAQSRSTLGETAPPLLPNSCAARP